MRTASPVPFVVNVRASRRANRRAFMWSLVHADEPAQYSGVEGELHAPSMTHPSSFTVCIAWSPYGLSDAVVAMRSLWRVRTNHSAIFHIDAGVAQVTGRAINQLILCPVHLIHRLWKYRVTHGSAPLLRR